MEAAKMKIKKIVQLCKSSGFVYLFDGDSQMLSDGSAVYYLTGCPEFSLGTLMMAYDITDKQVEKLVCNMFSVPPAKIDVRDVIDDERLIEPMDIDVAIRGKRYKPYRTSSGVSFIERKYLEPFIADGDDFELYERTDTENKQYFAVKIGMYLLALIYPSIELLKNERFITELEELCAKSKVAYNNAQ